MNKTDIDSFVEILYWDNSKTEKHILGKPHSHDYWQIEYIVSGDPVLELDDRKIKMRPGDAAAIPPEFRHRFNYFRRSKESCSFKFSYKGFNDKFTPLLMRDDQECELALTSLAKLSVINEDMSKSVIGASIISGLMRKYFVLDKAEDSFETALAEKVRKLILQKKGGRVDVSYLAGKLGYSRDYFSALFKKDAGMPLKSFIDNERVKIACRFLEYSEYNINEISEKMGFADQFAFSHFFKRATGMPPSSHRLINS